MRYAVTRTKQCVMREAVSVIDDERAVTEALRAMLEGAGYVVHTYDSARAFLADYDAERPGCIILDECMPEMAGHALQQELVRRGALSPVIVISAKAAVPMAIDAMRLGAITLLQKPFDDQALLDAVAEAMDSDRAARRRHRDRAELEKGLASLTGRQREVLELLIRGMPNKVIASELGISERTVELHRARVLRVMRVRSAAELAYAVGRTRGSA